MPGKNEVISVTSKAADQIALLVQKRNNPVFGIRICIKSGGCSGYKYCLEYAEKQNQFDELIKVKDINLLIDGKALMYLMGSEMDYTETQFKSGFVFSNPNEKAKCGCGESFNV